MIRKMIRLNEDFLKRLSSTDTHAISLFSKSTPEIQNEHGEAFSFHASLPVIVLWEKGEIKNDGNAVGENN